MDVSTIKRPELHLDVSTLQMPVLLLDMSTLQGPYRTKIVRVCEISFRENFVTTLLCPLPQFAAHTWSNGPDMVIYSV